MTELAVQNAGPQPDPIGPPVDPSSPEAKQPVAVQSQDDYWGFEGLETWYFPDGVSFVQLSMMNEGSKAFFQKATRRDVTLERDSGNAKFNMDPAEERHALIKTCVVGWNLKRNGDSVKFSEAKLAEWLGYANPKIVEDIEAKIREMNPWLDGEQKASDIKEELDRLQKKYEDALERERGEGSSSSK